MEPSGRGGWRRKWSAERTVNAAVVVATDDDDDDDVRSRLDSTRRLHHQLKVELERLGGGHKFLLLLHKSLSFGRMLGN